MSDIIRLLPDSVANQIAAGEVIQRPASVVKELVENSVDAGARCIEVIISDSGRTLIQVVDDGSGMSDTDARMAFERHATSKIVHADDLFSLRTMGFRGEALASICAVAQVELRTRREDSDVGVRLVINGSHVEVQEPAACAKGSNIMVKNLFFNVPARRKFLKKDAVEFGNIAREFERLALVNPGLDLTLRHNDTIVHQLLGGSLKQRISDLFGKTLEKQLIPVTTSTSIVTIDGFVGNPESARRRNPLQYLTVNGRHMRHPYFQSALHNCFEPLIAADHKPNYFLNFSVDPSTIDVNIHPTKNEIKFENESAIWQILCAAVREALGRWGAMPGIDFDTPEGLDIPVFNPNCEGEHRIEVDPTYNPFATTPVNPNTTGNKTGNQTAPTASRLNTGGHRESKPRIADNWDALYRGFMDGSGKEEAEPIWSTLIESRANVRDTTPELPLTETAGELSGDVATIQVRNKYILSGAVSGVMVIDQHRAHIKVLYEKYLSQLAEGTLPTQQVMFPEVISLTARQNEVMKSIEQEIREMGFDVSPLGDNAWSIVAVPSIIGNANPAEIITGVIDDASSETEGTSDQLRQRMALSMARSSAIAGGRKLNAEERDTLLTDLLRLPSPNYTPDGLPVIRIIAQEELEKLF